jgi:hypothetical protein
MNICKIETACWDVGLEEEIKKGNVKEAEPLDKKVYYIAIECITSIGPIYMDEFSRPHFIIHLKHVVPVEITFSVAKGHLLNKETVLKIATIRYNTLVKVWEAYMDKEPLCIPLSSEEIKSFSKQKRFLAILRKSPFDDSNCSSELWKGSSIESVIKEHQEEMERVISITELDRGFDERGNLAKNTYLCTA